VRGWEQVAPVMEHAASYAARAGSWASRRSHSM
jgi:hypothetical protein